MRVKTRIGEFEVRPPGEVIPRVKFWAGAMQDLVKLPEVWGILDLALREAYEMGQLDHLTRRVEEVVELGPSSWSYVGESQEQRLESGRSEHQQPVALSQADGSAEHPDADGSVHGSSGEVPHRHIED